MDVKERIQQFLDYKGININQFEISIGVSKSYWRKTKSISANIVLDISRVYTDLNLEWLFRGTGEMLCFDKAKRSQPKTEIECVPIENSVRDKIPYRKFVEITQLDSSNPMCIINTDRIIKVESERGKVCTFYLDENTIVESSFKLDTARDLLGIPHAF